MMARCNRLLVTEPQPDDGGGGGGSAAAAAAALSSSVGRASMGDAARGWARVATRVRRKSALAQPCGYWGVWLAVGVGWRLGWVGLGGWVC